MGGTHASTLRQPARQVNVGRGTPSYAGKNGAVEMAALLRRVHYAKFWRSGGAATSFQVATARHAPG